MKDNYYILLKKIDELTHTQHFIDNFLLEHNINLDIIKIIHLVVNEICINVFTYGWTKINHLIQLEIKIFINKNKVELLFIDNGIQFNPLKENFAESILKLPVEERPIGGIGIYLVKHFADNLKYKYYETKNHLTFIKYL